MDPHDDEFELSQTFVGHNTGSVSNKDKFDSSKEFEDSMTPQYHNKENNEEKYGQLSNVIEEVENNSVNRSTAIINNEIDNENEIENEIGIEIENEDHERLLSNRSLIEESADFRTPYEYTLNEIKSDSIKLLAIFEELDENSAGTIDNQTITS